MTILELAKLIREITGSNSALEFVERPLDDPSQRQPDITLARSLLDWEPRVDTRAGLLETVEWFQWVGSSVALEPGPVAGGAGTAPYKVAVVGTGYVGAVTSICMAYIGHEVWGVENDAARAGQLNRGQAPFFEPGLSEMLKKTQATGRLHFTDDTAKAVAQADFVFLCVGTPPGSGGSPDLAQLEVAIKSLAPHLRTGAVVVNKSTVPVGSGNWTRTMLEDALGGMPGAAGIRIVSNPEFLHEGSAINDFLYPDRIVLGGPTSAVSSVAELYRPVLNQSFAGGRPELEPALIATDLASAEMIKYAANAFLAAKISLANEIAHLCESFGIDARQVLPAIGADHRIGSASLQPGLGWGGSCPA
jgi:nucleotide sugar dehydrogenase